MMCVGMKVSVGLLRWKVCQGDQRSGGSMRVKKVVLRSSRSSSAWMHLGSLHVKTRKTMVYEVFPVEDAWYMCAERLVFVRCR